MHCFFDARTTISCCPNTNIRNWNTGNVSTGTTISCCPNTLLPKGLLINKSTGTTISYYPNKALKHFDIFRRSTGTTISCCPNTSKKVNSRNLTRIFHNTLIKFILLCVNFKKHLYLYFTTKI